MPQIVNIGTINKKIGTFNWSTVRTIPAVSSPIAANSRQPRHINGKDKSRFQLEDNPQKTTTTAVTRPAIKPRVAAQSHSPKNTSSNVSGAVNNACQVL